MSSRKFSQEQQQHPYVNLVVGKQGNNVAMDDSSLKKAASEYCDLSEEIQALKKQQQDINAQLKPLSEQIQQEMERRGIKKLKITGTENCIQLKQRLCPLPITNDLLKNVFSDVKLDRKYSESIFKIIQNKKTDKRRPTKSYLSPITNNINEMKKQSREFHKQLKEINNVEKQKKYNDFIVHGGDINNSHNYSDDEDDDNNNF